MIFDPILIQATYPILHMGKTSIHLWWFPFVFTFAKVMFILLDIILVVAIVMVLGRFKKVRGDIFEVMQDAMASGRLSKGKAQRKWEEAQHLIDSDDIEENKKAAIIAAAILDDCLRSANLSGGNLESRILQIPEREINFRDDIVWAYRMKVRLESEAEFETDKEEVERVFYIFERVMKELNIL